MLVRGVRSICKCASAYSQELNVLPQVPTAAGMVACLAGARHWGWPCHVACLPAGKLPATPHPAPRSAAQTLGVPSARGSEASHQCRAHLHIELNLAVAFHQAYIILDLCLYLRMTNNFNGEGMLWSHQCVPRCFLYVKTPSWLDCRVSTALPLVSRARTAERGHWQCHLNPPPTSVDPT